MRWLEIVSVCDAGVEIPTGELQPGEGPEARMGGDIIGLERGAQAADVLQRGRPTDRREGVAAHAAEFEREPGAVPPHGAPDVRPVLSGGARAARALARVR